MRQEERRAAIAVYKERKAAVGIYRVRCIASGQIWVGHALDLAAIGNRLLFTLRQGSHRDAGLQSAWRRHDETDFAIEEVERLDEDALAAGRDRVLKARRDHWCAVLGAPHL